MRWYSRISLGLSLAVASTFLVAYWRSLDSHGYPNMNAPGAVRLPAGLSCLRPVAAFHCVGIRAAAAKAGERSRKSAAMDDQPGAVDGAALFHIFQSLIRHSRLPRVWNSSKRTALTSPLLAAEYRCVL
ncbi:hypothetical protein PERCYII40_2434 [Pseudomonas aeruginosa]|nr:hypothetical protein PERCYII40_2434 [Pseudomonas aeruginosa]